MHNDLERLKGLLAIATARPWHISETNKYRTTICVGKALIGEIGNLGATSDYKPAAKRWSVESPANADLIAAAVNALPDLIAEIEALRAGGWQGIESAPHACHVLAARWDDCEWMLDVVSSPPSQSFTYWRMLPDMPQPPAAS